MVEPPQRLLDLGEFYLGLCDDDAQGLEALFVVGLVVDARLVLVGAVVLDLLARVLDLCQA